MLTPKELVIMECLWITTPLSCADIQHLLGEDWKENAIHDTFKTLQRKNMIRVADTRKSTRKPAKLYAPIITNAQYLEHLLTSNTTYKETMLPLIFHSLLKNPMKQQTIDELYEMIQQKKEDAVCKL